MCRVKIHIVILLLAVFTVASTAGAVMAHCGHEGHFLDDNFGIEANEKVEKECGSHLDAHGQAAVEIDSALDMDHASNPAGCDDCSGVPCQSQIQIPEGTVPAICVDAENIHSKIDIKIKPIYLTIIPDPPKQIS